MACGLKIKNDWIEWLLNEWLINWSRSHFGLCFGKTSVFEMNNGRAVGRKTCHDIGRASLWKETPLVVEGILISLFHIQMPIRKEPGSMWIEPGFVLCSEGKITARISDDQINLSDSTLAIRAKIRRCARILNFDTPAGWLLALSGIAFYFLLQCGFVPFTP